MTLDFSRNGVSLIFETLEDGRLSLKHFSKDGEKVNEEKALKWCAAFELHLSGENQDDHHGGKHTGSSGSFSLKYESHKEYENEFGTKIEIILKDEKTEATLHYQFYNGIPALRSWSKVKNIGEEDFGMEYISSFAYTGLSLDNPRIMIPHNSWKKEANWRDYSLLDAGLDRQNDFSMKRIMAYNTGMWSCKEYLPMGAYYDKSSCLLWQIESNGSWEWEVSDISNQVYLRLSGPTELENNWYKVLKPGEEFESVKACLTFGIDFEDALSHMTKYRRIIFENSEANKKLPVIFNDYMHCLWADPTTEKMLPVIDKAAEAGAEYYVMDAGWYADGTWWETVGEWLPQEKRFPNGINEVFDYVRSKGMIPGIWLEGEVMGIGSPIADKFEDECYFMRHGKKVIDHGRYQLDFRHPKVREYISSIIDRFYNEYGIRYIKTDYNIEAGVGTEVNADSFGDGLLGNNRAYLSWVDETRAKYPDLVIEGCSSGGMRIDYAHMAKHHLLSISDNEDWKHTAYIAAAIPTAVIPEQSLVWSYPRKHNTLSEIAFIMISSMLQRMNVAGEIWDLSDEQMALVQEAIKVHKNIRGHMESSVPFYPLGVPQREDGWISLGFKTDKKEYLAVWRMNGKDKTIKIPYNAEKANILYPSNTNAKIKKAKDFIKVTLPENFSAVLLELK